MTGSPRAAANVKRYDPPAVNGFMNEWSGGSYVLHSDYAALEAERDAYKALAEGLEKLCVAYRFGRPVSEATFTKIEAARALLARIEGKGAGNG